MRHLFRSMRVLPMTLAAAIWAAPAAALTVFAAASLGPALEEIAADYGAETGERVVVSAAGSSLLARQIEFGAPADLFVSANAAWMDRLERGGRVVAESRRDLLGNTLVIIGPRGAGVLPRARGGPDLAGALGRDGRLAVALTDAVPAGIYGKAALRTMGVWERVRDRLAEAENTRAALALVAAGAVPIGLVYATDAAAEPRVSVLDRIDPETHPRIVYPAAVVTGGDEAAAAEFLAHLAGPRARAVFERHGFPPPAP